MGAAEERAPSPTMARPAREAIPHHQTPCAVQTLPHCWNSSKGMLTKQLNLLYKVDYWRRKMSDKNWHSLDIFIGEFTHFISLEFRWKMENEMIRELFFRSYFFYICSCHAPSCEPPELLCSSQPQASRPICFDRSPLCLQLASPRHPQSAVDSICSLAGSMRSSRKDFGKR